MHTKICKALLACAAEESQTQNRIMRTKSWPACVPSNGDKETENSANGNIAQIRKRKECLGVFD